MAGNKVQVDEYKYRYPTCSEQSLDLCPACNVSSVSCGRPEVMWHSQALHGQARQ